jgi:hypothetical protein
MLIVLFCCLVKLVKCILDHNVCGVSVNSGSIVMENCVVHSNNLIGVGISGEHAQVAMKVRARQ